MAYATENFKTKKALKEAVANPDVTVYLASGGLFPTPTDGTVYLEGPHYPAAHTWYAQAVAKDGVVIKVK